MCENNFFNILRYSPTMVLVNSHGFFSLKWLVVSDMFLLSNYLCFDQILSKGLMRAGQLNYPGNHESLYCMLKKEAKQTIIFYLEWMNK